MCLLGGEMLVDFWLAQNPLLPTTDAKFSVREILKFATSNFKVANFKICFPSFLQIFPLSPVISFSTFPKKVSLEIKMNPDTPECYCPTCSSDPEAAEISEDETPECYCPTCSSDPEASEISEDESPTTSDDEFIVSDSEIAEAEAEESEEDDIELLYESFVNLREENKLFKQELAKQNNLLWEIYDELKENQRSEAKRSEAKRCFEIMNMNDKHSYSLMRPADRLTYGDQSKSTLWLTRDSF